MPAQTVIRLRSGTAAQWASVNPVLAAAEVGLETDTNRTKYGNGTLPWNSLSYSVADASGVASVDWSAVLNKPTTFPPSTHTHAISDVTSLQVTLDGKAATVHVHAIGDITGLQTALDGKAATSHTHTLSQITDYTDPTIYIDGGAANTVYAAYANIDGGNSGSF